MSPVDEVVAEGRWHSQDPKALVNGLPIGPKAVKVFVDVLHEPETFLWRPTMDVSHLQDCLQSFVVWPVSRVAFEDNTDEPGQKSPHQTHASSDQRAGGKSAATVSKGHVETSTATCTKSAAPVSKSTGEKSPAVCQSSPTKETQLASQSPLRRSAVNYLDMLLI